MSPLGLTADYKPVADAMIKSGVIPIMVLHAEYHQFIADSTLLSTLITYQNGQVHDVPGRTVSPYEQHEIFSFSLEKPFGRCTTKMHITRPYGRADH